MAYTNPDILQEVANILDDFEVPTIIDLFKDQIITEASYTTIPVDQFESLYQKYKMAVELNAVEEDDIDEIRNRFKTICISIVKFIEAKFGIEVDLDWFDTQNASLPAVTLALYKFFVLDLFYIIIGVLNNYISKNLDELNDAFSAVLNNKDVTVQANLKTLEPKYATIASAIFDVTDYSFTMMDNDSIFEYMNLEYQPAGIIQKLLSEGVIVGDFTRHIADIYKENLELRSKVAFELVYRIKTQGSLPIQPIEPQTAEIPGETESDDSIQSEPATEAFVDSIERDVDN